ncbi:MAG TPA: hypothetical protein VMI75_28115, partial [Polyangiaceae bacterium]|nr:hypothetical protein [Polyangiaceae bacterium]
MAGGQVNITIADGGSATIIVPGSTVQLVLGCSDIGTTNQIIATRTPATLLTNFGYGPLTEAAGMAAAAGGTVLAMKVPSNTAGAILLPTYGGGAITTASNTTPIT